MRIISGLYKGRLLEALPGKQTRPTLSRVREAWASSMQSLIPGGSFEGAHVLDPFAGSGALGLELLSRGAESCLFIEQDKQAMRVLRANINTLGLSEAQVRACMGNSLSPRLPSCIKAFKPFDIVVLDPPYMLSQDEVKELLGRLFAVDALAVDCLISYEHAAHGTDELQGSAFKTPDAMMTLQLVQSKAYGTVCLEYYVCIQSSQMNP